MAKSVQTQRIDAVRQLLELFRMERIVYITVTLFALLILLTCATMLNIKGAHEIAFGLFGASGIITYTTGRLLRMWNQAFAAVLGDSKEGEND
jgi:hypothetical protein